MSIATARGAIDERPMKRSSGLILAVLCAAIAFARPSPAADEPGRGTLPQQTRLRLLEHVEARIRILEEAKECLRAADDLRDAAACHETERQRTRDLRNRDRAKLIEGKPSPAREETPRGMGPR